MIRSFEQDLQEHWDKRSAEDRRLYERLLSRVTSVAEYDGAETCRELVPVMVRLGLTPADVHKDLGRRQTGNRIAHIVPAFCMREPHQSATPLTSIAADPQGPRPAADSLVLLDGQDRAEFAALVDVIRTLERGGELPLPEKVKLLTGAGVAADDDQEAGDVPPGGLAASASLAFVGRTGGAVRGAKTLSQQTPGWRIKYAIVMADAILRRKLSSSMRVELVRWHLANVRPTY